MNVLVFLPTGQDDALKLKSKVGGELKGTKNLEMSSKDSDDLLIKQPSVENVTFLNPLKADTLHTCH